MAAHDYGFSEIFETEKECKDEPFEFDKSKPQNRSDYSEILLEGKLLIKDLAPKYFLLQHYKLIQFAVSPTACPNSLKSESSQTDEGVLQIKNCRLVKGKFKDENE